MPDRPSDDDPLVRSWRRSLDRLRSEEERRREEPPERGPPGDRSGETARPAEARGFLRRLVVGAAVLLLGAVVGFLVWNAGRGEDTGGAGAPTPVAAAGEAARVGSAAASGAASAGTPSTVDRAPTGEASEPVAGGPTANSVAAADSAAAGGTASEPGETPELLDLTIGDSLLAVSPGASVDLPVRIRDASGRGRAGVALVLDGSEELPGVEERLEAVTDSAGRAVFRFPVGAAPDTVVMDVLARGYWLRGPIRVIVRVLP